MGINQSTNANKQPEMQQKIKIPLISKGFHELAENHINNRLMLLISRLRPLINRIIPNKCQ